LIINNYIRRSLAAFFILLFSFCVTPKRFLHDILANHQDAQTTAGTDQQIAATGFHCHVDDLVVVAPFLPELPAAESLPVSCSSVIFSQPVISFIYFVLPQTDGRGPPADVCA
jgi:hypothetical protein